MAGYIGSKAAVTQADGYTKSEAESRYANVTGDVFSGEVGIGTGSDTLTRELTIKKNDQCDVAIVAATNQSAQLLFGDADSDNRGIIQYDNASDFMAFTAAGSERMRIDSSGNLLVGKSAVNNDDNGLLVQPNGNSWFTATGNYPLGINRKSTDGALITFTKDQATVGSIATWSGELAIGRLNCALKFDDSVNRIKPHSVSTDTVRDNVIDMGSSSARFDDIYATNGNIQTSDRNEKQDIEELTEAEQRVALAAKGLLRKFRWKSAVAEKGEAARTHFGIIAQDLQAAFAAEGLDAGDYAMFISSTWWEHEVEVPAVEADEEKGIEAADAYTRIDTYDTAEEAPEGATQKTRLGVRYSELLAFIIGAL